MKQFIIHIIEFEKKLEYCRQDLALDENFSIEFFPESITYLGLRQLFNKDVKAFFNRYDADRDGKLSFQDVDLFVQPRQKEYQYFTKKAGNYNRLIELILIADQYEQYLVDNQEKIEFINEDIQIKQYLNNKFKPVTDKDIWYLNQRFECNTLNQFVEQLEKQQKRE